MDVLKRLNDFLQARLELVALTKEPGRIFVRFKAVSVGECQMRLACMSLQNYTVPQRYSDCPRKRSALAERNRDSHGDVQIIGIAGFMSVRDDDIGKMSFQVASMPMSSLASMTTHGKPKRNDNGYVERLGLTRIKNSVDEVDSGRSTSHARRSLSEAGYR